MPQIAHVTTFFSIEPRFLKGNRYGYSCLITEIVFANYVLYSTIQASTKQKRCCCSVYDYELLTYIDADDCGFYAKEALR